MKTINIGAALRKTNIPLITDISDKQPCWYANFKDVSPRSKAKCVVGIKDIDSEKNKEYSFKVYI